MAPSIRELLPSGRRMLTFAMVGFACGAVVGILVVLLAWFPGAMTTYSENPQFVDPRSSVIAWSAGWALVCGALGLLIGLAVGAIPSARDSVDTNVPSTDA
jgi:hypothetical protein